MDKLKKMLNKKYIILWILFGVYIALNLIYLTRFPFVHSDESWLSGLSRNMAEKGSFSVTETFFDLYIRNPHAIKIIFHAIQIVFIWIFGYSIFTVRLISLLFGLLVLIFQYKLCAILFRSKAWALCSAAFLALDVQFIYASHFARQEIILLFVLTFGLYFFLKHVEEHRIKYDIVLGIVVGLSIGIHPNSFIISVPFGFIYLYHVSVTKRLKLKNLLVFAAAIGFFAVFFVSLSLSFDPNFFADYAKYGDQFDVFVPLSSKLSQVGDFFLKLYYGVSGTYYTPDIRFQFFLFPAAFVFALFKLKNEKIATVVISIAAVILGIIFVGRYNQTSIIFVFPLFYILVAYMIMSIKRYYKKIAAAVLAIVLAASTVYNALPYLNSSYDRYLNEISKAVKSSDRVLANLNTEYYFENGKLFDYRNLGLLRDNNMSFKDYIRKNKIQYIIYPEEMDLIYTQRPKWNGLYGNLLYYNDMQSFFKDNCSLVYEFKDSVYGMRIVRYINTKEWNVKIYKVDSYY